MIKTAMDKGFFDRCIQRGITDVNQIQYLAKMATDMVNKYEMQKQSALSEAERNMLYAGLAGSGLGAAGGAYLRGIPGAIAGGLGGGLLGAGSGYLVTPRDMFLVNNGVPVTQEEYDEYLAERGRYSSPTHEEMMAPGSPYLSLTGEGNP